MNIEPISTPKLFFCLLLPLLMLSAASQLNASPAVQQNQSSPDHELYAPFQAITFRGNDNNIHHLEYAYNRWQPIQLTSNGTAAGDPVPFDNGSPHIVFRDTNGHLHLLLQVDSNWQQRQITQDEAQRAQSDPSIYQFGTIHIIYQGMDDQLHEILLDDEELTHFTTTGGEAQKSAGKPMGFVRNGEQHVVYRSPNNHIRWMRYDGNSWIHNQISAGTEQEAAGDPQIYFWGTHHVTYRGMDDHIHELVLDGSTWNHYQLTFGDTKKIAGNPIALTPNQAGQEQIIVYRSPGSQINTLTFDGASWNHAALSTQLAPAAASDFSTYNYGTQHVIYRGQDRQLHELVLNSNEWVHYQPIQLDAVTPIGDPAGFAHIAASPTPPQIPIRMLAEPRDIKIGPAVNQAAFENDALYREVLAQEFSILTAENVMKFGPIHPEQNTYAFERADTLVQFAQDHNMTMRGHTLVWHNQQPDWLTNGTWTRAEMIAILEEHIATVVGRYKGKITYWDVINEAIDDETGELRATIWLDTIGPDYVDIAFRAARAADPDAILIYNDYSAEEINPKSDVIYTMVQDMQARGVPIDGVGFQMHISTSNPPDLDSVATNMARFAALGLQTQITETDIRILNGFEARPNKRVQQAQLYRDTLEVCLNQPACTTYQMWGFTDKYTWVYPFFGGEYPFEAPLPFDPDYRPKPAYFGLIDALAPEATRVYLPIIGE